MTIELSLGVICDNYGDDDDDDFANFEEYQFEVLTGYIRFIRYL